jgi:hypothetical protein
MHLQDIRGIARAQRLAREVLHDVAPTLRAGDREIDVARRIEERLGRAGVRHWLHTAYAWWGERTRFAGFAHWEPDALPTERRLAEDEPFIIDVAPLVDGYPADYAYAGALGDGPAAAEHGEQRRVLAELKADLVAQARRAATGADLFRAVGEAIAARGFEAVHPLYPGGVLGHSFSSIPRLLARAPRIGDGFQLPLVGTYALALLRHRFAGARYPFINPWSRERPQGVWAVEPHLARGSVGAKFESILVIDGDETRWLDPDLYGEVQG